MEILCFTIKGKLAHFRKYYANNTALSFSIPPRTTLMGMVAAMMGWKKDSYYEKLSSDKVHFGVRVLSPLKKRFQRLNFLSIKKTGDIAKSFDSDFRGAGGRIQTPFEVVSGLNITKDEVAYQIFLASVNDENSVFDDIKDSVLKKVPVFNLSLGPANFQASLQDIEIIKESQITIMESNEFVHIHSAIPVSFVEELKFDKENEDRYNFVEEDMMPGEFAANNDREVVKMNRLLYSTTSEPLRIKVKGSYFSINTESELLNIQFMDR
jgi:CRISPR-associated protein Cas5h